MADEPPVSPETPTPTPEKKSHTTRNVLIIVLVIVVILALFFGLFFGLRGCDNDEPDDVNPDPEIVEPGPVEDPDGDDDGDGEPEHTHTYGDWQYDGTYHWKECSECGDIIDKAEHTLGDPTLGDDGYYQTCSVCGYTTTPVEAVPTSWKVETSSELTIETTNSASGDAQGTLDLDEYVSITIYDQYGGELSGEGLDSYTVTATSGDISITDHIVTSTTYETGTASVVLTSTVIDGASKTLSITLTQKAYSVTQITVNGETSVTDSVKWGEAYTATIAITPSYASNTGYEITSDKESGSELFTVEQGQSGSCTFTHNKTHSGNETFTVTALDGSGVSASITITAEPEILEPQSAAFDGLGGTYEINTVINNLDNYLKVNFNESGHDVGDFVDDTCTVEYTSSDESVVSINNSAKTATCVGTGTSTITATITPDHDTEHPISITTQNGAEINVKWTASTLTMSPTTLDLTEGESGTLSVTIGPDGQTTNPEVTWAITEGSDYVSISATTGTSITVTATQVGSAVITASADGCSSVACAVTITQAYNFATDSWETINEICTNGEASTYYNIGDTKTITINGESHDIRIIDFDHDDLTNTDGNGYNDENYNGGSNKAAITVEMVDCLSTTHNMNSSTTNSGGWYSCEMRSYLNSDEGCVLSTLDSNLQSVIKKVDKKSTKGGTSTDLGTTASDSLFLLAEVELDGTTTDGYKDEGTQYAYWSEHDSDDDRIKYQSGVAHVWCLRSPLTTSSFNFYYVESDGKYTTYPSIASAGVSFAFCI